MNVDEVLSEREEVYGDFSYGTDLFAKISESIEDNYFFHTGEPMRTIDRVHLWYLLMKIVRLSVSPSHLDTWRDLEGYSKLIHNSLKGEENAQEG